MKPFAFQILYNYTLYTVYRYPGSTFMDHVIRYQDTPGIKMIVMLGEVGLHFVALSDILLFLNIRVYTCLLSFLLIIIQIGGTEEYKICQGIKEGRITKPVVCWCIGTCATMFASEVCLFVYLSSAVLIGNSHF